MVAIDFEAFWSKCCHSGMTVRGDEGADENAQVTQWYECNKCKLPCDFELKP